MEKQTAGHEQLGEFAPKFAELNDDILFGEVWSREKELSAHERSVMSCGLFFHSSLHISSISNFFISYFFQALPKISDASLSV